MGTTLELEPLVFVREVASGAAYAFPVGEPKLVERGETVEQVLDALRAALVHHLEHIDAVALASFVYPEDSWLHEEAVLVPRSDLPSRFGIRTPISIAAVAVPDGRSTWGHLPALEHSLLVRHDQDLSRRIHDEVRRVVGAREIDGEDYLRVLPGVAHRLVRLSVEIERSDLSELGARAGERRKKEQAREHEAARKLLAEVAVPVSPSSSELRQVVGAQETIAALGALLTSTDRLGVVVVGPESVGKSAVIAATLARLPRRPVYATSGTALVAGQSGFGQLEERIDAVMRAAERLDAILYFDNLGDLFAGTVGGIEDMASIIRPYIAQGRVRLLAEASAVQLEHHEKHHVGFFAHLHRVQVEPLDAATTRVALTRRIELDERRTDRRVAMDPNAVETLVELAERYLSYESFPGKAIRLYEELVGSGVATVNEDGRETKVGVSEVYEMFAARSGIPVFLLRDDRAIKYEEIEGYFGRRIIGQREAIGLVAQTLCMVKAGLQPPTKPLANFLFVGPTGVGKTEVAKTLAGFLFGGQDRMIRFDMSEYMDPFAAERLIRGTDREEGELTRKVRQQPFCVVLLDEIEKAHPAVFDLLLQVCGEGRLTDARGRTTYFHNAIIIMTSNLGASHRTPGTGFGRDEVVDERRHYVEQVDRHFRPEFVNRLDRIVPFGSLGPEEIARVARLSLERIAEREGLPGRGLTLEVSEMALEHLARTGYSDRYGARALRRHLEDHLVAPLSRLLARHGPQAQGGRLRVRHLLEVSRAQGRPSEDDEAPHSAVSLAQQAFGELSFELSGREGRAERKIEGDLELVAALRRSAAMCLEVAPILELRERVEYLVADMNRTARTADGRDLGWMSAEHAHLCGLLRALDDDLKAIEVAEDLAMVALFEGEGGGLFRAEAEQAHVRFERDFVRAIIGAEARNEISILVRSPDAPFTLRRWIVALALGARERGWDFALHRFEDPVRTDDWPSGLPWGEPRTLTWVLDALEDVDEATLAKQWRGALIRVSGGHAGALMRLVLGIWRYEPIAGGPPDPTHVEVFRVWDAFEVSLKDLASEAFTMPPRVDAQKIAKMVPEVHLGGDGGLRLANEPEQELFDAKTIRGMGPRLEQAEARFWTELERFVFLRVARATGRGDDLFSGEGDA